MKPAPPVILTINGGSSSIKFALFEAGGTLRRLAKGDISRIGLSASALEVKGVNPQDPVVRSLPSRLAPAQELR